MLRAISDTALPPVASRAWLWGKRRMQRISARHRLDRIDRLHLGCGERVLAGWGNLDLDGGAGSIRFDLTQPVPKQDGSVRLIYSEHFIEHLSREAGLSLLRECRRVLRSNGVLRISTPDLRFIVDQYRAGRVSEWADMNWHPTTPCQLLNESMRLWGHVFLYDEPELTMALQEAGFARIQRVEYRHSAHSDLSGLETRPFHHDLIVEAQP
jgi:predicted SAM-dependent methyltransferase